MYPFSGFITIGCSSGVRYLTHSTSPVQPFFGIPHESGFPVLIIYFPTGRNPISFSLANTIPKFYDIAHFSPSIPF